MATLVKNKKALFNYHILEKIEAGLVLEGHEVKSIRSGKASLDGAYVVIKHGEAYLINCYITPYQPKNTPPDYLPRKDRKLLLKEKEINYLTGKSKEKGVTLVPLQIYAKQKFIKLELAVARGKKKKDKRETIKKREIDREIQKEIKKLR